MRIDGLTAADLTLLWACTDASGNLSEVEITPVFGS
jgi:hypothetical protein